MNECTRASSRIPSTSGARTFRRRGATSRRAYDALKRVDPKFFVWGLVLSPRGNRSRPTRAAPRATNPVDWLGFLGAWCRFERLLRAADGRARPASLPDPAELPFRPAPGPTSFSVANLPRAPGVLRRAVQSGPTRPRSHRDGCRSAERGGDPDDARCVGRGCVHRFENGAGVAETGSEAYQGCV